MSKKKNRKLETVAKAGVGGVAGVVTAVTYAMQDGEITSGEWVGIVLALLGSAAAVWVVPNKDPQGVAQDESVQPPKRHRHA